MVITTNIGTNIGKTWLNKMPSRAGSLALLGKGDLGGRHLGHHGSRDPAA